MASPKQPPKFTFAISVSASPFGCRLGSISLHRQNAISLEINTPGLLVTSSRGVIPHLSRDHIKNLEAARWVNIPFESFLERNPPLPTVYPGPHPMHDLPGYLPDTHIVSVSARNPSDGREMPANGKDHVSVNCVRGVRKLTPSLWRSYTLASNPDFVVALSDTPFTRQPYSQKRLTKSIDRSTAWLASLLCPQQIREGDSLHSRLNVLVHMAGGANISARQAFSDSLLEPLHGPVAEAVQQLEALDQGVAGYVFDLVPLHDSLAYPTTKDYLVELMQASLRPLPSNKLRIANSAKSPHEILRLIHRVGIDIFDSHWAQQAADVGMALDFIFPVSASTSISRSTCTGPRIRDNDKHDLGHNLYDQRYVRDFSRLALSLVDGSSRSGNSIYCPCAACSPVSPMLQIRHSVVDEHMSAGSEFQPPYTRAYLHHLLHTHEMSAHAFLVMHNLSVLDTFFAGIRTVIGTHGQIDFGEEVERFCGYYDESQVLMDEAKKDWKIVDLARGKGRLVKDNKGREKNEV